MSNTPVKISAAIVGAAGYAAGELARLILQHPYFRLSAAVSVSSAGRELGDVHPRLRGATQLKCVAELENEVDIVFLCRGHGASAQTLKDLNLPDTTRVIDLSRDFRAGSDESTGFLYGLPEMYEKDGLTELYTGRNVANPGCFATCILLACLPLVQAGIETSALNITAITGASGAGYKPRATTHYPWRNDNLQVYNAFKHPHLPEVRTTLVRAASTAGMAAAPALNFIPMRGPFTRGILASLTAELQGRSAAISDEKLKQIYQNYYAERPLVHMLDVQPDLSQVVHTSNAVLHVTVQDGVLHLVSVIDNLLKGAAGQAVQNANLISGLPEECGLTATSEGAYK